MPDWVHGQSGNGLQQALHNPLSTVEHRAGPLSTAVVRHGSPVVTCGERRLP
nr:hypothetical protein [Kibdelosporangium sp. MJ126-NF4]CTQ88534.1 hypothetical protein [Kibdelosporangium sp. MJ126-NF4]